MAISTFPTLSAGGGGRTDFVFGQGAHTVDISEGFYILDTLGIVLGNGSQLSKGFQKLPNLTSLSIGEPDLDNWTSRTSTLSSINRIGFGDGLFLAGGNDGQLATSTDGINWSPRTSGFSSSQSILEIIYGNQYLAVGVSGVCTTSFDGITWTAVSTPDSNVLRGATFGNGVYVVGGDNGSLASSTNLSSGFTARSSDFGTTRIRGLAFGDGVFVAVGDDGKISSSANGETGWTLRTTPTSGSLQDIAFGDGVFVAVASNGDIVTSTDGTNWTSRTSGTSLLIAVTYGSGFFVATTNNGEILTSPDGITWTSRNSPTSDIIRGAGFGDSLYVLGVTDGEVLTTSAEDPDAALLLTQLPEAIQP